MIAGDYTLIELLHGNPSQSLELKAAKVLGRRTGILRTEHLCAHVQKSFGCCSIMPAKLRAEGVFVEAYDRRLTGAIVNRQNIEADRAFVCVSFGKESLCRSHDHP